MNTKPTLGFFGTTGGCTLACLKLTELLLARGIPSSTLSTHLTLIEGSTSNLSADTVRNILAVFKEYTKPDASREYKPELVCILTTGLTMERDITLPMVLLLSNDGGSQPYKVWVLEGHGEGQNTAGGVASPFTGYMICREDIKSLCLGFWGVADRRRCCWREGRDFFGSVVSISH
ncbi:hypothetical protein BDV11DRAFT_205598 [Aspergillus similis]